MHRKSACLVLPAQMALLPVTSESANSVCTGFIRVLRAAFTERGAACLPADQPPQMDVCQQGASPLQREFRAQSLLTFGQTFHNTSWPPAVVGVAGAVVEEEEDLRT